MLFASRIAHCLCRAEVATCKFAGASHQLLSLELWKTSRQVTAGGCSQLKCIGSKIPKPLPPLPPTHPILAYDRSTSNLSSYKSLHHTAHVPNLLRDSTHVPPRRWWACGAWYGRELQHNSRDTRRRPER